MCVCACLCAIPSTIRTIPTHTTVPPLNSKSTHGEHRHPNSSGATSSEPPTGSYTCHMYHAKEHLCFPFSTCDTPGPVFVPWRTVDISKECSWDAHIAKVMGKGKTNVGNMGAIVTDSHLYTINMIKMCILINVILPKLQICTSMGREREVGKTAGNSTADSSSKNTKDAQVRRVITVLRAEMGAHPLKEPRRAFFLCVFADYFILFYFIFFFLRRSYAILVYLF